MAPELIVSLAVKLLDIVLGLIGPGHTQALLTQADVDRANAMADAVEYVKFHSTGLDVPTV